MNNNDFIEDLKNDLMKQEERRLLNLFADYKAGTISADDISLIDAVGILRIQKTTTRKRGGVCN